MTKSITLTESESLLDERKVLTLAELCQACHVHAEKIEEMVAEGILEPGSYTYSEWRFSGRCLRRARVALRLQQDLKVNLAGAALALNLLDEIDFLRAQLGQ